MSTLAFDLSCGAACLTAERHALGSSAVPGGTANGPAKSVSERLVVLTAACWLAVAAATVLAPSPALADAVHVEQAMLFIRASCAVKEASLQQQRPGDGRLHLHLRTGATMRGSVSLVHADLERFADLSLQLTTQQSLDISACMEPAINQVIATLMELPNVVASLPLGGALVQAPNVGNAGAYIPPVLTPNAAVSSAPLIIDAVAGAAPAPAPDGDLAFAIQGCRATGRQVICEVRATNGSRQDYYVVLRARQTVLYDAAGGAYPVDDVRLGNQGGVDYRGSARFKVIADTAPVINLIFHRVPDMVHSVKRLEVSLGTDSLSGVKMKKLVAADLALAGR